MSEKITAWGKMLPSAIAIAFFLIGYDFIFFYYLSVLDPTEAIVEAETISVAG